MCLEDVCLEEGGGGHSFSSALVIVPPGESRDDRPLGEVSTVDVELFDHGRERP